VGRATGKPVSPPLEHASSLSAAAFSPDGGHLVTASFDATARVWDLSVDRGSLDDWRRLARCSLFALVNGVLETNPDPITICTWSRDHRTTPSSSETSRPTPAR
jgi:WD40 repeat protein